MTELNRLNNKNTNNENTNNIEYSENIQDTYYKVLDYCNPMYVNIHNKPSYAKFFNVIYDNIDMDKSSQIIKKIKKINNENNPEDDNYYSESYEQY